jgi:hypothetical protein
MNLDWSELKTYRFHALRHNSQSSNMLAWSKIALAVFNRNS